MAGVFNIGLMKVFVIDSVGGNAFHFEIVWEAGGGHVQFKNYIGYRGRPKLCQASLQTYF
jgi:hypothetical protein